MKIHWGVPPRFKVVRRLCGCKHHPKGDFTTYFEADPPLTFKEVAHLQEVIRASLRLKDESATLSRIREALKELGRL